MHLIGAGAFARRRCIRMSAATNQRSHELAQPFMAALIHGCAHAPAPIKCTCAYSNIVSLENAVARLSKLLCAGHGLPKPWCTTRVLASWNGRIAVRPEFRQGILRRHLGPRGPGKITSSEAWPQERSNTRTRGLDAKRERSLFATSPLLRVMLRSWGHAEVEVVFPDPGGRLWGVTCAAGA